MCSSLCFDYIPGIIWYLMTPPYSTRELSYQASSWTNIDLFSVISCTIYLRACFIGYVRIPITKRHVYMSMSNEFICKNIWHSLPYIEMITIWTMCKCVNKPNKCTSCESYCISPNKRCLHVQLLDQLSWAYSTGSRKVHGRFSQVGWIGLNKNIHLFQT